MRQKYFDWALILSVIGILLASFLLWEQIFQPSFQPCNINSTINCTPTINGPLAKTLGIPTPLIGLLGYILILFGALKKFPKLILGMSAFGLLFCIYIGFREIVGLHIICPVCVLCQLDMIAVFVIGLLLNRKEKKIL